MRILPGDPAAYYATGPLATQEEIAQVRQALGLDRPWPEQLARYLRDIAAGDLGRSLVTGQPVGRDLLERFPASFELTFVAMTLALIVSIPLGIVAAIRAGSWIDHLVRFIGTIGVSMPAFVAGIVLIYVLYFRLGIAPEPIDRIDPFMLKPPTVTGLMLLDSLIARDGAAFLSAAGRLHASGAHHGGDRDRAADAHDAGLDDRRARKRLHPDRAGCRHEVRGPCMCAMPCATRCCRC